MAIISLPDPFNIQAIDWRLDRPAQVNRSTYTGARRVVTQPGHARWSASLTMAPIVGEANVRSFRAFLAKLKGQISTFRVPAVVEDQFTVEAAATVYGNTSAGVTTLTLLGELFAPQLAEGQTVMINGQLLRLDANSTAGSGADLRVITFTPALAAPATNGTPAEIDAAALSSGVSAGDTSATIEGPFFEAQFEAGQMLTIGDQLVVLTEDSEAGSGVHLRVVQFEPPLRAASAAGARVERVAPTALVALTSSETGWSIAPGQIYGIQLDVEEAF